MADTFDLVVIGAGPGGYVCAIKAAQLGLKVACVDKRATFGGTCLNVGCIPSKALLNSSHKYAEAKSYLRQHGVEVPKVELNLGQMLHNKDKVVEELTKGIAFLFKKNKVTGFNATAKITAPGMVSLSTGETLTAKNIVIATGSESVSVPGLKVDEKTIVSSTGALSLEKVPGKMIVVGGGYIGLELGSVWSRLGSEVTVVEYADRIVPAMDHEVGQAFQKSLEKQGLSFRLGQKVTGVKKDRKGLVVQISPRDGKGSEEVATDVLLVSVGRKPNTEGLGLDQLKMKLSDRGMIEVNAHYQTSLSGIYAIGDVVHGPMLAHKAEEEGVAVAEHLAGKPMIIDHNIIPAVVYTHPEVATVGLTEEQLKEQGIPYRAGKFPFMANSRAKAMGETEGFVKVLSHKETDRVLGVHILGSVAGTMIAEAAAVMTYGGTAEDFGRICHAHPTESEAVKEAGLAASGIGPLHV